MNLFEDWLRPFYLATITCCFLNMFIIELNGQGLAMSGNQKLPGGKRNNRDAPNTPGSFGGSIGHICFGQKSSSYFPKAAIIYGLEKA